MTTDTTPNLDDWPNTSQGAIYRYEIPVDDLHHTLELPGDVVAYGCRHHLTVELWAWAGHPGSKPATRTFLVVGTGHLIEHPENYTHRATVVSPDPRLVWHILEVFG